MKKNEKIHLRIEGMTLDGNGVGRHEGMAVFVPMTTVGDAAEVQIVKVQKRYAFGIVTDLQEASVDRTEPDCPVYRRCGGCVFRHLRYEAELRCKERAVEDAFVRIGGFSAAVRPIVGAVQQEAYRNKAQLPVAQDEDGRLYSGFYASRSHRIISQSLCRLHPPVFSELSSRALTLCTENGISAYNEQTGKGSLRHLYLRCGSNSGELMLCFVTSDRIENRLRPIARQLALEFPQLKSILQNINPEKTNVILGKQTLILAGKDRISDTMCGVAVELSPHAFYQVHTKQAERLYEIAAELANLTGTELLLDLYCGIGTIGLSMANRIRRLIGVELVPQAVENARENAKHMGASHAEFFCGDAGEIAEKLAKDQVRPDVLILDPPRKGCSRQTLDACLQMQPQRIVMISCNPATAARDCAILCENQYSLETIQPVDLFPRTGHVECVILLSKKIRSWADYYKNRTLDQIMQDNYDGEWN